VTAITRPRFRAVCPVGKALASGKRLELLDLLAQSERNGGARRAADLGVTTASAHLQILRQANLVTTRRDGPHPLPAGRPGCRRAASPDARRGALTLPDVEAARLTYFGADGGQPVTRAELASRK
jgi:DNA-binding transcriptional ArsR family regulator